MQLAGDDVARWRDHQVTVWGKVVKNCSGKFWKMEVLPVSTKGKKVLICFPAGHEGSGWRRMADGFTSFVGGSQVVTLDAQASHSRHSYVPINTRRTCLEAVRMGTSAVGGGRVGASCCVPEFKKNFAQLGDGFHAVQRGGFGVETRSSSRVHRGGGEDGWEVVY